MAPWSMCILAGLPISKDANPEMVYAVGIAIILCCAIVFLASFLWWLFDKHHMVQRVRAVGALAGAVALVSVPFLVGPAIQYALQDEAGEAKALAAADVPQPQPPVNPALGSSWAMVVPAPEGQGGRRAMNSLYRIRPLEVRVVEAPGEKVLADEEQQLQAAHEGFDWGSSIEPRELPSEVTAPFTPTVNVILPANPKMQGHPVQLAITGVLEYPLDPPAGSSERFQLMREPISLRVPLTIAEANAAEKYQSDLAAFEKSKEDKERIRRDFRGAAEARIGWAMMLTWIPALVCFLYSIYAFLFYPGDAPKYQGPTVSLDGFHLPSTTDAAPTQGAGSAEEAKTRS